MAPKISRLVLSAKEYDVLSDLVQSNIDDSYQSRTRIQPEKTTRPNNDHNAAAFRAATRIYLATSLSLKGVEAILAKIRPKKTQQAAGIGSGIARYRLSMSLALLLFSHRVLYRVFTRLRLQLLHERVRDIERRYPMLYKVLTSRLAPAVGASLSGLALGIYPASQLRITITIYALVRALELLHTSADAMGFLRRKPRWLGSWMVFALAQGQLLHALVFDRDCFPEVYGSFMLQNTHEYMPKRLATASEKIDWPSSRQMLTALAEMAHLRWPPFLSPILHPTRSDTLPPSIDPTISSITSGAHPAIQNLSCALLHPTEISCFVPYLRQILLSFPALARFFSIYYGVLSILSIKKFFHAPGPFLDRLSQKILRTTVVISGSIATAWGSICLFSNFLPRNLIPEFRFFLGGVLGGSFAIIDQSKTGHGNAMYTLRTSLDSLWKVGKKRSWWRGIKGGDVMLFAASLAVLNVTYDLHKLGRIEQDSSMGLTKVLRGETEIGMQNRNLLKDKKENE